MQGKTKSFFEDTMIILVLAAIIAVCYSLYDDYSEETNTNKPFVKTQESQPLVQEKNDSQIVSDNNTTKFFKDTSIDFNASISVQEPKIDIKKSLPDTKKEIKIEEKIIVEKEVDLTMLKSFLKSLELKLIKSIVHQNDVNSTKNRNLRFRITLLKDGNYEQLTFVEGNKELFKSNKNNILKIFPVDIDDKIRDEFPRYIRIKLQ